MFISAKLAFTVVFPHAKRRLAPRGVIATTLFSAFVAGGCLPPHLLADQNENDDQPEGAVEDGAELRAKVVAGVEGIDWIRFDIFRCNSDLSVKNRVFTRGVEIRDGITVKGQTEQGKAKHRFADLFKVLEAGCYDVYAEPFNADGSKSRECSAAMQKNIELEEGKTQEIYLLTQCASEDATVSDVFSSYNRPPEIESYQFIQDDYRCGAARMGSICIKARDKDANPLEYVISVSDHCKVGTGALQSNKNYCWDVRCDEAKPLKFDVQVYDLFWQSNAGGSLKIRIEDWLIRHGGKVKQSHAHYSNQIQVPGVELFDDRDGDGFGDSTSTPQLGCLSSSAAAERVPNDKDCDDSDSAIHPDAVEIPGNEVDENCDGCTAESAGDCEAS